MTDPSYMGPVPDISDPSAAATYELDGHIATITYNRPEAMNAINGDMRQCLNAAWMEVLQRPRRLGGDHDRHRAGVLRWRRPARPDPGLGGNRGPGSYFEIPTINSLESGLELFKPDHRRGERRPASVTG